MNRISSQHVLWFGLRCGFLGQEQTRPATAQIGQAEHQGRDRGETQGGNA